MHDQFSPALSSPDLVWTRLPNDEFAWLRPSTDAGEPDDALYVITDQGRRQLATEALFGQPWPRVSDNPNKRISSTCRSGFHDACRAISCLCGCHAGGAA